MQELSTTIAHYILVRRLARGGMSEVYLARDTDTGEEVALKIVQKSKADYCARFKYEVQLIGDLMHEHILPALDYGECDQWCYLVMPYIEHGTLADRLERGPLTLEEAGRITEQLVSALHYVHKQGIIHRDIKPSNILLRDGQHVYLADFGLAQPARGHDDVGENGCLMGTAEYMAPELAESPATNRSDIYALGVLLYQMLTGCVPFKSATPMGVYWKHIQEQPAPPSTLNPAIPAEFERVILRALEKNPKKRFRTAADLSTAYTHALAAKKRGEQRVLSPAGSLWQGIPAPATRGIPAFSGAFAVLLLVFAVPLLLNSLLAGHMLPAQARIAGQQVAPHTLKVVQHIQHSRGSQTKPAAAQAALVQPLPSPAQDGGNGAIQPVRHIQPLPPPPATVHGSLHPRLQERLISSGLQVASTDSISASPEPVFLSPASM